MNCNFNSNYLSVVLFSGILERDVWNVLRPIVIWNLAFIPGSSKQGNARRASVGENWVVAKYLSFIEKLIKRTSGLQCRQLENLLLDSVVHVGRSVESVEVIVELADKVHRQLIEFADLHRVVLGRYEEELALLVFHVRMNFHRAQFNQIGNLSTNDDWIVCINPT